MSRIRLIVGVSTGGIAGIVLAGCSSLSTAPPPPQALQFESTPPGVNVQTSQGQTCRTPCSLAVPVMSQSVMFALDGYVSQTIPISVREGDHSWFNSKPPLLLPNPVQVAMVALPPPPKGTPKLRRGVGAPKVVPKPAAAAPDPMPSATPGRIIAPEPEDNGYSHAPPWSQSPSGSESPFPSPAHR
jgi:hypothetical protein